MKFASLAFVVIFAFAGCGEDDTTGDNGGNGGNGGNINPTTGTWLFVGGNLFDDTCDVKYTDPDGDFTVTSTGDGTFTVDDGTIVFDCTVTGSSFTCPARLTDTIDASPLDAVGSIHTSITGTLSSATAASGHQTANLTCAGTQCIAAGSAMGVSDLPCSVSQYFTASLAGS